MPKTPIKHTIQVDGTTDVFSIPWPYIDKGYVRVQLNNDDISETIEWLSPNTIKIYPKPLLHSTLVMTRDTPSGKSLTEFTDGSWLEDEDIKRGMTQSLHVMEETLDEMNHATNDLTLSSAEAVEAARNAKASEVVSKAAESNSLEYMRSAQKAADRAELAAGGQYPEVELNVVTEIVEEGESLAGSYDPETGTLTFKIPKNLQVGGGGGGSVELTDRVDLSFSTVAASAKAVKLAYDTALAARPPLGSTTTHGILRLATPQEHMNKASGVAAQPSEVDVMIRSIIGETTLSSPSQDGLVGRGGDYGEVWTRVNDRVYGWTSGWDILPKNIPLPFWGEESEIPPGWLICDGENGTPDLRNRVIIGAGDTFEVKSSGGSFTSDVTVGETTLTVEQIPPHSHTYTSPAGSVSGAERMPGLTTVNANTSTTGGGRSHSHPGTVKHTQPYVSMFYIIKL